MKKMPFVFVLAALAMPAAAADFTVTVKDADVLAGITWAREQANAASPQDAQIATDEEYVQSRILQMIESYATQKARIDSNVQVDAAVSTLKAKIEAAREPAGGSAK